MNDPISNFIIEGNFFADKSILPHEKVSELPQEINSCGLKLSVSAIKLSATHLAPRISFITFGIEIAPMTQDKKI